MSRVLITGITGMVGSHLADYLLENTDWKIYGLCRWNDSLENIEHLSSEINIHYTDVNEIIQFETSLAAHYTMANNNMKIK